MLDQIWTRAGNWGTAALLAGAGITLLAGRISRRMPEPDREKANLLLRLLGLAVAVLGALRIFRYIG